MRKHRPEGEKFISEEALRLKKDEWKAKAQIREQEDKQEDEPSPYGYVAGRKEEFDDHKEGIESLHRISFIKQVIPELIAKKTPGEKVRILDVGAGYGVFTDQIRQTFGDKVRVFSTGLSKKAAKTERKRLGLSTLHKDDLRWRSIQQLRDFEEFDLIVDTLGEQDYQNSSLIRYLSTAVSKLREGGICSIYSIMGFYDLAGANEFKKELESQFPIQVSSVEELKDGILRFKKVCK